MPPIPYTATLSIKSTFLLSYIHKTILVTCVEILLDAGANVNATNKITGATPLHCAIQSSKAPDKRKEVILLLLSKGKANASLGDSYGSIPYDYCDDDDTDLKDLLQPIVPYHPFSKHCWTKMKNNWNRYSKNNHRLLKHDTCPKHHSWWLWNNYCLMRIQEKKCKCNCWRYCSNMAPNLMLL